jgi:hypothetical protein
MATKRKSKASPLWPAEVEAPVISFADACYQIMVQAWRYEAEDDVVFTGSFRKPNCFNLNPASFRVNREWNESSYYDVYEGNQSWQLQDILEWMQRIVDSIKAEREREVRRKQLIERLTPEERDLLGIKA